MRALTYMYKNTAIVFLFALPFFFVGDSVLAQEVALDQQSIMKAEVVAILSNDTRQIEGTAIKSTYQKIKVRILEDPEKGKVVEIENDYLPLKVGEEFFVRHLTNDVDGTNVYSVADVSRLGPLAFFVALFIIVLIAFGGKQGLRGFLSLLLSVAAIFYLLLPGILHGYSPLLLSLGISSVIIIVGSYITHGFNKTTSVAVLGMLATVVVTCFIAYVGVNMTKLSGFGSEEATYLNFDTRGTIDFSGLLLGSIIIGLLGVLYDAAIGQAIAVEELFAVANNVSKIEILRRGIRMGREHIGALVNTLAIAYVGASLPLLLLFYNSKSSFLLTVNRELFAGELIRTIIGSIGLILAVPITTFIAVEVLHKKQ